MVLSKAPQSLKSGLIAASLAAMIMVVPAQAQTASADAAADTYAMLLQQIADLEVQIERQNVYLQTQDDKISSLESQIEEVALTNETINPMIDKMVAAIENEINSDLPFKPAERYARLDSLKELAVDPTALPADKMRRALSIYDVEVDYGQSLEAYEGDNPLKPGTRRAACLEDVNAKLCNLNEEMQERLAAGATIRNLSEGIMDGTYLRYGRLALAYDQADGSETLRYDPTEKTWVPLSGNKVIEVRRAIRIARGESAPGVVSAPVVVN